MLIDNDFMLTESLPAAALDELSVNDGASTSSGRLEVYV